MTPDDKKFHDAVYGATKKDRERQTAQIVSKLDELKPVSEVSVTNFPEQKVEVLNFPEQKEELKITNLEEITSKISEAVSTISEAIKNTEKPEEHTQLLSSLSTIAKAVENKEIPATDLEPLISQINSVVSAIKSLKLSVDITPLETHLRAISANLQTSQGKIDELIEYGRVKVTLPDHQVKLLASTGSISGGGGSLTLTGNPVNKSNPVPTNVLDSSGNVVSTFGADPVGLKFDGHTVGASFPLPVDTELPAATALADGESATAVVPRIGTYNFGLRSDGTANQDRATLPKLVNLNTTGGQFEYNLGTNLRSGNAGGSKEVGIVGSPLWVAISNNNANIMATYGDGSTTDTLPVYSWPFVFNNLSGFWDRQRAAQLTYSGAGIPAQGLQITALAGYYFNGTPDLPPTNSFHIPQITQYRALHENQRDSSGNEILQSSEVTLLASASRTTTQTGADIINYSGFKYLHVTLDMTVVTAGPSVTLTVQGKDPASGQYYTILAGAPVVGISTNVYRVGPGLPVTANVSASDILPRTWRIVVTANNANAGTYSVGYSLVR